MSQWDVAFVTQELLDPGPSARLRRSPDPQDVDPDLELVDAWRGGDEQAFASLVTRHGHRFRREARFSTFVYRVAVNAALNRRRSLGRRRQRLENLAERQAAGDHLPSAPRGPEDSAAGGQIQERVQEEIQRLSPALRAPLVLYDMEGLPYAEIAEALQLREGTVKSRIHRARQALRERLRDLIDSGAEG